MAEMSMVSMHFAVATHAMYGTHLPRGFDHRGDDPKRVAHLVQYDSEALVTQPLGVVDGVAGL